MKTSNLKPALLLSSLSLIIISNSCNNQPPTHPLTQALGQMYCECEQGFVNLAQETQLSSLENAWDSVMQASLNCMKEHQTKMQNNLIALPREERQLIHEQLFNYQASKCPQVFQAKEKIHALMGR